nr:fatty-acid amide hydrolase 2-A [Parasteatoda tepidariorum]
MYIYTSRLIYKKMGEMELKPLPFFAYWGWRVFVKMFYWMFHIPLSIIYWGDGKTVPPVKNNILLKSATKLAEEIRLGKLKSEEVVLAYIERIIEVEPYINAVAENRFQEAIKEAKIVDELIESGTYTRRQLEEEKPLLGVPFTTKILLTVKGLHSSAGSTLFKDVIAADDAPTITLMKNAGAIVLATTNSAELGLGFDTINPLYGKTCNPYDTHRTPGGSSGGESALLGAAGTVIGLGNDVTGSVRVPTLFTGVFSHKPSRDLVPNTGCFPAPNLKTFQYLSTGPMCRYAEDLITMMNVLTSRNAQKIKFGQPVNFKKLKIYYQFNLKDPVVQPVDKEIVNAMKKAINYFTETYGVVAEEVNIKLLSMSNIINFHLLLGDIPNLVEMMTAGKLKHLNGVLELLKFTTGSSSLFGIL